MNEEDVRRRLHEARREQTIHGHDWDVADALPVVMDMIREARVAVLRELADDGETLWEVARARIEEELVEWRDSGMFVMRNNGFVIKYPDGGASSVIRFGPEVGVRLALLALADHLEGVQVPGDVVQ